MNSGAATGSGDATGSGAATAAIGSIGSSSSTGRGTGRMAGRGVQPPSTARMAASSDSASRRLRKVASDVPDNSLHEISTAAAAATGATGPGS